MGDRYLLHTSKRLRSYVQSPSGITLTFQDGSSATCDILVGADGIHSAVRRKLLEDTADSYTKQGKADDAQEILKAVEPAWSGTTAYRAVFPTQKLAADYPDHRALTVAMHVCLAHPHRFLILTPSAVYWKRSGTCISEAISIEYTSSDIGLIACCFLPHPTRQIDQLGGFQVLP